jgi:hypothetical protein
MNRRTTPARVLMLALPAALALAGCDDKSPPPQPKQAHLADNPTSLLGRSAAGGRSAAQGLEAASQQAAGVAGEVSGEAQVIKVGQVEFRPPADWEKVSPGPMQKAALKVNNDPDLVCAFFSDIKGDVASNVNRWRTMVIDPANGQPAESRVVDRTIGTMKVKIVSMSGSYKAAGSSTATPDTGFRGAIFDAPGGLVFVRLTGPKAKVDAADAAWMAMITGAKRP